MFQHFQGCLVRQVDDAQISHSSSCCVEWKENWPETPRETKKKRERHKISSLFQTDNQGSKLEPSRESGGKNTHAKAAECVEIPIESHLLFPTLHQLSANGEQMILESQTEQQKGKTECIHPCRPFLNPIISIGRFPHRDIRSQTCSIQHHQSRAPNDTNKLKVN